MDALGIQKAIKDAPAELQPIFTELLGQIGAIETKTAADVSAIADKVISALTPMVQQVSDAVNTMTLTVNASVVEALALARRIDGATFSLGPEIKP